MAEYSISSANINGIENNISVLNNNIHILAERLESVADSIDYISGHVTDIDSKVDFISTSLNVLTDEFKTFVEESKRVAALSDAKQNVVMLEQQVDKEYGHYDNIRRHTVGILQAADLSVVKKDTITSITEELMLSAPRYWLAPALIALAAWISNDRELAEKALQEAMRRDDEKTSLMFCLINRRAGRLDGSLVWLERYFAMQDPAKMERKIIVVLDAFASGLFGADSKGVCSDKIKGWLEELSGRAGFVEEQKNNWEKAIIGKKVSLNNEEFPYLQKHSVNWPDLKDVLEWAKTHNEIYGYFSNIFNTPVNNAASISSKMDDLLDNLVANYDNEELPLRKQLRRNRLIIEESGNLNKANARFDAEIAAYEQYEDFSQHLTSIVLAPESSGALIATQKLAISLSKDWIFTAYEDITVKSRSKVPLNIEIAISNWTGNTRDGSNELELQQSLNNFIDDLKNKTISSIKWFKGNIILAAIIGIAVGLIGLSTIIVPLLAIVGVGIYIFMEKSKYNKTINTIKQEMEEHRDKTTKVLNATLAEVVDYRRLLTEKDLEYKKVEEFFQELKPEQYIASNIDQKFRQVI